MYPVHDLNLSGSCHQSHDHSTRSMWVPVGGLLISWYLLPIRYGNRDI